MVNAERTRFLPAGFGVPLPLRPQAERIMNKRAHVLQRLLHFREGFHHDTWLLEQQPWVVAHYGNSWVRTKGGYATVPRKIRYLTKHLLRKLKNLKSFAYCSTAQQILGELHTWASLNYTFYRGSMLLSCGLGRDVCQYKINVLTEKVLNKCRNVLHFCDGTGTT